MGRGQGSPDSGATQGQHLGGEPLAVVHDHGVAQHVLQLADIARPVIGDECCLRPLVEADEFLALFAGVALQQHAGDEHDVLLALAQGR